MPNALDKIRHKAKQLKKQFPHTAWKNLIKKASAAYRAGKLGQASYATAAVGRKKHKVKKKRHSFASHKVHRKKVSNAAAIKQQVIEKFGDACIRYEMAKTIPATKKAAADKNKWRKILKSISK